MHLFFKRTLLPAVLLIVAGTTTTYAQDSNTRKLFIQSTIDVHSLNITDGNFDGPDNGGGFTLRAGWGVSDLTTLFLGVNASRVDGADNGVINEEYEYGALEVGARFNFRAGYLLVPYVDIAARVAGAQLLDEDIELAGTGLMLGGGASYFVSPTIALNAGLYVGFGTFTDLKTGQAPIAEDELSFGEARFSFGVIFYPLR